MKDRFFIGNYEYKIFQRALWLKIYYQDVDISEIKDFAEARFCNEPGKYSIIEKAKYMNHYWSDSYEYLLEYPGLTGYNRWKQKNYPLDTINKNVIGFVNISCSWTEHWWKGLAKSTSGCTLLDGSIGTGYWFYAIGMKANCSPSWVKYFPGPSDHHSKVYLWMRVNLFVTNYSNNNSLSFYLYIFTLICSS